MSWSPILPPSPNEDSISLNEGLSGAYLGIVLRGVFMAGGSIGLQNFAGVCQDPGWLYIRDFVNLEVRGYNS